MEMLAYALHAPQLRLGVSDSAYCRVRMVADLDVGGLDFGAVTRNSSSLLSGAHQRLTSSFGCHAGEQNGSGRTAKQLLRLRGAQVIPQAESISAADLESGDTQSPGVSVGAEELALQSAEQPYAG